MSVEDGMAALRACQDERDWCVGFSVCSLLIARSLARSLALAVFSFLSLLLSFSCFYLFPLTHTFALFHSHSLTHSPSHSLTHSLTPYPSTSLPQLDGYMLQRASRAQESDGKRL